MFHAMILLAAAPAAAMPAFMAGCWEMADGDHWTEECWTEPRGGLMLGGSREGKGSNLQSWEQLRIAAGRDGRLTLFASPAGRPAVPFTVANSTVSAVEFTNASHDYPQRIRYELKAGKLEAEISRIDGSKPVRWTYSRKPAR